MDILPFRNPSYLIYLAIFAVAAAGCLAGAWQARYVSLSGVRRGLSGLLVAGGLWALCHVGVLLSPGLELKTTLYESGLVVGFATVWAWLWLCSAYSGRMLHRRSAARWTAFAVFGAATVTKITNRWHGAYFSVGWSTGPFPHLAVDHHAGYWLTTGFSYALVAVGFFMLARPLRRAKVGGQKLAGLFALTALPLGANAIGYATPYLLDLSHEPAGVAAFAIGALALNKTSRRSPLEETSRVGRENRPIVALSPGGQIRNYNQAAADLFQAFRKGRAFQQGEIAGSELKEALPRLARALGEKPEESGKAGESEEHPDSEPSVEEGVLEMTTEGGQTRYFRPVESRAAMRGADRLVTLQDVTEQELRRRKRASRLGAISDSMPGLAFELRAEPGEERSIEFLGEEAGACLGLSAGPEDSRNRVSFERFVERVPEDRREGFLRSVEEAVESRSPWRCEFPFDRPDEGRLWLLGSAELETTEIGEGKEVLLFQGLLLDITERKEADRELRRERDRLETLFESLPSPIVRCRVEGQQAIVERANAAFAETFEPDREEVEGRDLNDLLVPAGQQKAAVQMDHRALEEDLVEHEVRRVAAGGELRDFRVQVAGHRPAEGPAELYAIYADITDRKRREKMLRELQGKYRGLLEGAPDAIFVADARSGQIVEANQEAASLLGASTSEIIGRHQSEFHPSGEEEKYRSLFETVVEEAGTRGMSFRRLEDGSQVFVETDSGEKVPVEISATIVDLSDEEAGPGGSAQETAEQADEKVFVGIVRDITERRRRTRQLKEAKKQAERSRREAQEASRMKSAMLANMSHEIRTPLTGIIGFAEAIGEKVGTESSDGTEEDAESRQVSRFAGLIEDSGRRLLDTLDAVLNLSKLEARKMSLESQPVDLAEQARRVADEFAAKAEESGLTLRVDTEAACARADEGGLTIVLQNLLSNAIKYTEEGRVEVRTYQAEEAAVLVVEDTGIGMDPAVAESLFEPFRQASEGLNREYEGTGIGLAVTKRATEKMGGSIEVDTRKGEGSRFVVRLPKPTGPEVGGRPEGSSLGE